VFPAPTDRERIKSCLSELGEMSNGFKKALVAGLEQLVGTMTHRIRPVLDSVATVSYELSEEEYAENEVNDPWVQRLVHAVETNSGWLQPLMTSNNYDSFVHLVIDFIVKRLEVIMMQKKIHWRSATGPRCEGFDSSRDEDSESDYEYHRPIPNGHKYQFPDVSVEEKPTKGHVFDNFDEAYNMYLEYAEKARFSIRKFTTKHKKCEITHKYILCSNATKPRKTMVKDTLVQDNQNEFNQNDGAKKFGKNGTPAVTDCKAVVRFKAIHGTTCYKLYDFVENHNHPLVDENNMYTLRARRKLDISDKVFIHRTSLSTIGPIKAHRLRVAFMGGFHKVRGKPIDWKNFRCSLNKYIGPRDAQMLVDKMNDRKKHVPNFSLNTKL
ncbi:conserved oligomeric Golgi complex subunit 4, partial [Tanacetum coccineum]